MTQTISAHATGYDGLDNWFTGQALSDEELEIAYTQADAPSTDSASSYDGPSFLLNVEPTDDDYSFRIAIINKPPLLNDEEVMALVVRSLSGQEVYDRIVDSIAEETVADLGFTRKGNVLYQHDEDSSITWKYEIIDASEMEHREIPTSNEHFLLTPEDAIAHVGHTALEAALAVRDERLRLEAQIKQMRDHEQALVMWAKQENGLSWSQLGEQLGMSKGQAVYTYDSKIIEANRRNSAEYQRRVRRDAAETRKRRAS